MGVEGERPDGKSRVPPGQGVTKGFPVLHVGSVPDFDAASWRLSVRGAVENPFELRFVELAGLERRAQVADFHCVTGWSRLGCRWVGVPLAALLARAKPTPNAAHVLLGDGRGYSADVPLRVALADDALVALELDGEPLAARHGGPARAIVPDLYAWKSTKWLREIVVLERPEPGYWESRGYHARGDPWHEERFVG
ncbi:MAG: molybdopterin-dependent oxidoreductase [Planctomycetaceae bacterium]|nr:molybdopterin-dependent oxidoreductase [Planctomycetaceae bacterium]